MEVIKITLDEFLRKHLGTDEGFGFSEGNKSKQFSILFGNGLGKSYDAYNESKNQSYKKIFNFDDEEVFKKFYLSLLNYIEPSSLTSGIVDIDKLKLNRRFDCPEQFLNHFRIELIYNVVNSYIESVVPKKSQALHKFLKLFKSIYTINYDPIIYQNIFDKEEVTPFTDGFYRDGKNGDLVFNKCKDIENKIPFYFLHGAFHIIQKEDTTMKLSAKEGKKLLGVVKTEYGRLIKKYRDPEIDDDRFAVIILASKWQFKKELIKLYPYLEYCWGKLKEEDVKNIFLYGCRLKNDRHIIEALSENKKLERVFVSFVEEKLIEEVTQYCKESTAKDLKDKLIFVDVTDLGRMFWNSDI